mgnify:FL=1
MGLWLLRIHEGFHVIGIRLLGGLGNQMFQYAAARAAAERLGCRLVVLPGQTSLGHILRYGFLSRPWCELGESFPEVMHSSIVACLQLAGCLGGVDRSERLIRSAMNAAYAPPRLTRNGYRDIECYDGQFVSIRDGTWLKGFYQSERYFARYSEIIRAAFQPSPKLRARAEALVATFPAPPSEMVAVHVRRTDYLTQTGEFAHPQLGWALPGNYYRDALDRVPAHKGIAVFSDDMDYARNLLGDRNAWFAPDMTGAETLVAMARCGTIVIANSILSWWAGWLGDSPNKRVFAPLYHIGWDKGVWYPEGIEMADWSYIEVRA